MKQIHEQHCNCVKKIESTFYQPQIVLLHLLRYIKRSSPFDIINYYFLDIINFITSYTICTVSPLQMKKCSGNVNQWLGLTLT